MFQNIWIHYSANLQNLSNSLGDPTSSGRNLVASVLQKTSSYTWICEYELRSSMKPCVDRYEKGVCNLAWLNTYARRSRGRQRANAVYSDPTLCLISSKIVMRNQPAFLHLTVQSTCKRFKPIQVFRTIKFSLAKIIYTRLENGRTSNAII